MSVVLRVLMAGLFVSQVLYGASSGAMVVNGDWSGSGGNGYAYVFTQLGYRIHRELLMEPYRESQMQVRDQLPLHLFLRVIDRTKVIATQETLLDKDGHEQTAIFYNKSELRDYYESNGRSEFEIETILGRLEYGLIVVNEPKFLRELKESSIALATVFHEYVRASGVDDDNYRRTASTYDFEFFEQLKRGSSQVTKEVLTEVGSLNRLAISKIEIIDKEKSRVLSEMREDRKDMLDTLERRRPYVKEQRKNVTDMMNAYAETMKTMGFVVMPFPSANADTVASLGEVMSVGLESQQKLQEIEVFDMQVSFLKGNLSRNSKFFGKISDRRNELFMDMIQ